MLLVFWKYKEELIWLQFKFFSFLTIYFNILITHEYTFSNFSTIGMFLILSTVRYWTYNTKLHTFQPIRCPKQEVYNEPSVYLSEVAPCGWYENNLFLPFFDPTLTHSLAPKGPNKEFLKEHFSQEKQKSYYQFCDFKTDLKWYSWK